MLSWYLTCPLEQPAPPCGLPPSPRPASLPPSAPSFAGWGHSVAEVRSLFEGQIINPRSNPQYTLADLWRSPLSQELCLIIFHFPGKASDLLYHRPHANRNLI